MTIVPRSSLRSLVLLMSHGKPQLSSFFSSAATAVPGGDCPATDPPTAPVRPSGSSHGTPLECPNGAFEPVLDKSLSDTSDDRKRDITDDPKGLCNTLQPDTDKPSPRTITDPRGPIYDGSCSPPVTDKQRGPRKEPIGGTPEGP